MLGKSLGRFSALGPREGFRSSPDRATRGGGASNGGRVHTVLPMSSSPRSVYRPDVPAGAVAGGVAVDSLHLLQLFPAEAAEDGDLVRAPVLFQRGGGEQSLELVRGESTPQPAPASGPYLHGNDLVERVDRQPAH